MSGALLLALTSCTTGAVQVEAPTPAAGDRDACRNFFAVTPRRLADLGRRQVVPDGASAQAYGDPAVVVTCGGAMPATFTAASPCLETNGVGWYVAEKDLADQSRDVTLTTIGWQPIVSVSVPARYRPEGPASVMADLAMAVKRTLTLVRSCK